MFFDKVKSKIDLIKKKECLVRKFNSVNTQDKLIDSVTNYTGFNNFSERKNSKLANKNNCIPVDNREYKITQKNLFNLGRKFFRIVKYKSKTKDFYNKLIINFQKRFIYNKNADKLIRRILLKKLFSKKSLFENKLINIKKIIEEKSDLILKLEHEHRELRRHYENSRKETKSTLIENEELKEKIKDLEERLHHDDVNFKELFNKNLNDIKSNSGHLIK